MKSFLSLRKKIYSLSIISVALLISVIFVSYHSLNNLSKKFNSFSTTSELAKQNVSLSKDIELLKKSVLEFTYTGMDDKADHVHQLHKSINDKILSEILQKRETAHENLVLIQKHLEKYHNTFIEVEKQLKSSIEIKEKRKELAREVQGDIDAYVQTLADSDLDTRYLLQSNVYKIQNYTQVYYESLEFKYIKSLKKTFAQLQKKLQELGDKESNSSNVLRLKKLEKNVDDYFKLLNKEIQHTRSYQFLINVVMAAEAHEVEYHANIISEEAEDVLNNIDKQLNLMVQNSIYTLLGSGLVIIFLLALLSFLLTRAIVEPISKITKLFTNLTSGRTDIKVPAYEIDDEIGELSDAASYFLQKNKEIHQLLESKKQLADEANRHKSEFLANMSHEIRTPMNAVIGLSEILSGMELKAEQKNLVDKISGSSKLLLGIINDILDYSKIEAGKLELEREAFAFENITSQLWVMFEQKAEQKNIALKLNQDKKLPSLVISDELRLTQVLANLLSNALKFTEIGEVKLSITLQEKVNDSKALVAFSVEDSGIGMSKEQSDRLFNPFSQADTSTTRKYGGTGLGLVITKNIITALGGKINLQSQLDKGTTMSFTLEMDVKEWQTREQTTSDVKKEVSQKSLKGVSVLLVEDNEINQLVASMMLEEAEIEVEVASDGQEGVDKYLANPDRYNLILMDLQMPVLSGYEATKKIRQMHKDVPIVALTAAVMTEDKQKALKAGMNAHLAKPIDKQELYRLISELTNTQANNAQEKDEENVKKVSRVIDYDVLGRITSSKEIARGLLLKLQTLLATDEFVDIVEQVRNSAQNSPALIHSLKGASGNVGAKEIFDICFLIDKKYNQNQAISSEDITSLQKAIQNFLDEVQALEKEKTKTDYKKLSPQKLENLFNNVKRTLSQTELTPKEDLELLVFNLQDEVDAEKLKKFKELVEQFDFDEALEIMSGLR